MAGPLDGWIDVFRAGTWTDSQGKTRTWTAEDLERIAHRYETADPAPVVIGHPEMADPAYGWVDKLRVVDGATLQARLRDVQPDFRAAVESGRYTNRSVAVDPNDMSLVHLGFLGARKPAVPGLASLASAPPAAALTYALPAALTFAESEEVTRLADVLSMTIRRVRGLATRLREYVIDVQDMDRADRVITSGEVDSLADLEQMADRVVEADPGSPYPLLAAPAAGDIPTPTEPTHETRGEAARAMGAQAPDAGALPAGGAPDRPVSSMATGQTGQTGQNDRKGGQVMTEEELQAGQEKLALERAAFEREQRRAAAHAEARKALAEHVTHGRVLPAEVPALTELLTHLAAADEAEQTISYAAPGGAETKETAREVLLGYIARQPRRVQFGEMPLGAPPANPGAAADNDPTVPMRARMLMASAREAGMSMSEIEAVDLARSQAGQPLPGGA